MVRAQTRHLGSVDFESTCQAAAFGVLLSLPIERLMPTSWGEGFAAILESQTRFN
jgi:hypothetical protein